MEIIRLEIRFNNSYSKQDRLDYIHQEVTDRIIEHQNIDRQNFKVGIKSPDVANKAIKILTNYKTKIVVRFDLDVNLDNFLE